MSVKQRIRCEKLHLKGATGKPVCAEGSRLLDITRVRYPVTMVIGEVTCSKCLAFIEKTRRLFQ